MTITKSLVKIFSRSCLLFVLTLFICKQANAVVKTSVAGGVWSNAGAWVPAGVPAGGDDVVISPGIFTVDINTAIINDLTVDGTLNIPNAAGSSLSLQGNILINGTGTLNNDGKLDLVLSGKSFTINDGGTYKHNPRNGFINDESPFYNSIEDFKPNSNLIIQKWFDEIMPLGDVARVGTGNFGNVTLSVPGVIWDQDGKLGPHRIRGTFNVTAGQIIMDDGTGNSTSDTLQDVNISGTGSITFHTGTNRNLTLYCNNFTDNSTSAVATNILYRSYGILTWTVNGNLTINHNFTMIEGTGTPNPPGPAEVGNGRVTVTGNVNFNGSSIELIKMCTAPLTLSVAGTTTLGATTKLRFIDGNTGDLNFTTGSLVIAGGADNVLMGGNNAIPKPTGLANITVTNDFNITGNCLTYILNSDTTLSKKVRVDVGGNFNMSATGAELRMAYSYGATTFKTGQSFTMNGGSFIGQQSVLGVGIDSILVAQDFNFNSATPTNYFRANYCAGNTIITIGGSYHMFNSGTGLGQGFVGVYGEKKITSNLIMTVGSSVVQDAGRTTCIYEGAGNLTFTAVNAVFDMNGGDFRGIYFADSTNAGTANFNLHSLDFDGGTWIMHYGVNSTSSIAALTLTNNCDVNFTAATDQFSIAGLTFVSPIDNTLFTNFTVGGNLIISGAAGSFTTSKAQGTENVLITGNFNISGGNNSLNPVTGFIAYHTVNLTVFGSLNVNGGTTYLSADYGLLKAVINGDMNITAGTLSIKGGGGISTDTVNVLGGYNQSGGTLFLHNNAVSASANLIILNINSNDDAIGDFTQSGGIINFDNNTSALAATHIINIRSVNYTVSGGNITHANPGTGSVFGSIYFNHGLGLSSANMNYNRSGTHDIQQVKQFVSALCTLTVNTGNFQIASNTVPFTTALSVPPTAVLDLKNAQIFSNGSALNSGFEIQNGGRLRIKNVNGLYNIAGTAAINNAGNMDFDLGLGSTVEYYGDDNQVLTGIGVGIATLAKHKYGILRINFQGTPNTEYVYANPNVFVRFKLDLIAGELNLDNDHNPSNGGGQTLTFEQPTATLLTYFPGSYIRSETEDGSALFKWMMGTSIGAHIVPFGYDAAAANFIPVTYNPTAAGTTGDVSFGTYHTVSTNLPWPPGVTQLNNTTGTNNSAQTVDRFWYLNVSGLTPPLANISFTYMPTEIDLAVNPRAQKWMAPTPAWSLPVPGSSQSLIASGVSVVGTTTTQKSGWWALASQLSPLPVELLDFSASCESEKTTIKWTTASESNNDYFTVEKSKDGRAYEFLAKLEGVGNSSVANTYKTIDSKPFAGITYYRLSQTDNNRHTELLKTISAKSCTVISQLQVVVAPDVESGNTLLVTSPLSENFTITVFDLTGKQVLTLDKHMEEGFNKIQLNTKSLTAGVYFVNLRSESATLTQKFLTGN